MLRLLAIVSTLMSVSVMAQTPPARPSPVVGGHPPGRPMMMGRPGMGGPRGGNPACAPLKDACLKAGYSMTEARTSEKSVIGGCMAKYARGEAAKGVALKPTDKALEPCINFMKMKMAQMNGQAGAGGPARGVPRTGPNGQTAFSGNAVPPRPATGVQPKTPTPAPLKTAPKPGGK
jgi:hypothetical protein